MLRPPLIAVLLVLFALWSMLASAAEPKGHPLAQPDPGSAIERVEPVAQ